VIETFTALAEPSRRRIVDLLKDGPRLVGEIGTRLRLSQPQVSKHLRVLKAARLVDVEPRANQRLYGLRGDRLCDLNKWLESYRAIWGVGGDGDYGFAGGVGGGVVGQEVAGGEA
jgi:DNA-binding transcriptional ArsR family regulator